MHDATPLENTLQLPGTFLKPAMAPSSPPLSLPSSAFKAPPLKLPWPPSPAFSSRLFPFPSASLASPQKSWIPSSNLPQTWKRQLESFPAKFPLTVNWSQQLVDSCTAPSFLHLGCAAHDAICSLAVVGGSVLWFRAFDLLVQHNMLEQKLSRKLIHISTGLIYALVWPIYSQSPWSRFFALAIPLANVLRLVLYGLGILKDDGFVKSISREGTAAELLRGPLYYALVLCLCTVFFWRDSPVGMIALAIMCGGDGIADIVGRRIGGVKLPHNPRKSWAGSIAMFVFGLALSIGFLYYYSSMGFYHLDWERAVQCVALISLAATTVESLPISTQIDDNMTVPLVSVLVGCMLFS